MLFRIQMCWMKEPVMELTNRNVMTGWKGVEFALRNVR